MGEKKFNIWHIVVLLIIVALVIFYIVSWGKIDSERVPGPKEFKEDREEAKRRYNWYKKLLKSKKKLRVHLDRKFRRIHFGVRAGIILLWTGIMYGLFAIGMIVSLTGVVGYTTLITGFIILAIYLTSGTYYDLKEMAEFIKIRTENWIYGKYVDLDERIGSNELKIQKLETSILPLRNSNSISEK